MKITGNISMTVFVRTKYNQNVHSIAIISYQIVEQVSNHTNDWIISKRKPCVLSDQSVRLKWKTCWSDKEFLFSFPIFWRSYTLLFRVYLHDKICKQMIKSLMIFRLANSSHLWMIIDCVWIVLRLVWCISCGFDNYCALGAGHELDTSGN